MAQTFNYTVVRDSGKCHFHENITYQELVCMYSQELAQAPEGHDYPMTLFCNGHLVEHNTFEQIIG